MKTSIELVPLLQCVGNLALQREEMLGRLFWLSRTDPVVPYARCQVLGARCSVLGASVLCARWCVPQSSPLREANWSSSKIHCSFCERGQLAAAAEILNVNGAQLLLLLLLPPQPQALSRLVCNLHWVKKREAIWWSLDYANISFVRFFYLFAEGAFKTSFEDISSWLEWLAQNLLLCWWQTHSTPYKV